MEAAYYLLRLLLPRKLDFVSKRLEAYESIAEKIKANDLEELEKDLKNNRKYYEDLIPELEHDNFNGLVNENDDFDIHNYIEVYKTELEMLNNTVFTINTGDDEYNLTLDGEKLPKNICPNCKNGVKEIQFDSCPKCGEKHILFRIGADYDWIFFIGQKIIFLKRIPYDVWFGKTGWENWKLKQRILRIRLRYYGFDKYKKNLWWAGSKQIKR